MPFGKARHRLVVAAGTANEAKAVALALDRLHQVLAPPAEANDASVDHRPRTASDPLHVPEDGEPFRYAGDVLAIASRRHHGTQRKEWYLVECQRLHLDTNLLLCREVRCIEPGFAQRFHLRIVRPAKPCALAVATQRQMTGWREPVEAGEAGAEQVPAPFGRRLRQRAPLHDSTPVGVLIVEVDADALEHIGDHVAERLQNRLVGADHEHNLLPVVAGGFQVLLHLGVVTLGGKRGHAGITCQRRGGREEAHRYGPQRGVLAHRRDHELPLVDRAHQRPPHRRLVERWIENIRSQKVRRSRGVGYLDNDAVLLQQRQQIGGGFSPPVLFARLHRRGFGGGVRLHVPLNASEVYALRTRGYL